MNMKPVNSKELIARLEEKVEKHLAKAIKVYQNLSQEALNKQSQDGGWSIAQCLEHLNTYGDYYFPKMEKGMDDFKGEPSSAFASTWMGNYFTRMLDPETGKRKMKAFKAHVPPSELDGHAVVAKFIHQQETLIKLLRRAQQADMGKIRIPISISRWIKMNLGDTFRFIIAHDERHLQQAGRLL
jgi:uncharacterized damage-inducible protein DinB